MYLEEGVGNMYNVLEECINTVKCKACGHDGLEHKYEGERGMGEIVCTKCKLIQWYIPKEK